MGCMNKSCIRWDELNIGNCMGSLNLLETCTKYISDNKYICKHIKSRGWNENEFNYCPICGKRLK